jgi:hypothetical protein
MNAEPQTKSDKQPPRGQERLVDREARNPWFRWTLHIGAPLSMSLAVHVILIILFSVTTMVAARSASEGVEVELTPVIEAPDASALTWNEQPILTPEEPSFDSLADLTEIADVGIDVDDSPQLGESSAPFGEGRIDILGIGRGAGPAGSGALGASFGGNGRVGGRSVGIWGKSVIANKIAYVIDFSGSIIVAQEDLLRELKRSVGQLRPPQAFNVFIFYESGGGRFVTENFAGGGLLVA